MNKCILIFILFTVSCTKKENEITEIKVNYQHSQIDNKYSVSLIKENDSETMVHAFFSPTSENSNDSLSIKKMFRISTSEFNRIKNLVFLIEEKNIRKELNRKGLDGSTSSLIFGDGINFKQYSIWSPEHSEGKILDKYMFVNKEIFKIGGFDPNEIYKN